MTGRDYYGISAGKMSPLRKRHCKEERNITLTPEKRHELEVFTKTGERSGKLVKRAAIIFGYIGRPETGCRNGHRTPYRGKPLDHSE
jgi:hypothetical protein